MMRLLGQGQETAKKKGFFDTERCPMLRSDFTILNEVRRELARTEVILEKIQFGVTRGVVYFGGEFCIRMGVKSFDGQRYHEVVVGTLVGLEKRLRKIPGAKDVFFRFNNFEKYGGFWRRTAGQPDQS
jgi:hypothetical protein